MEKNKKQTWLIIHQFYQILTFFHVFYVYESKITATVEAFCVVHPDPDPLPPSILPLS